MSDLFKNRGMDTKPPGDPRAAPSAITPMTQDHVAMNQADHMQYQNLLQHGSVDDIKDFFQGQSKGPQPSWADVNTWVEHRDGVRHAPMLSPFSRSMKPDFDYQSEYNNPA